MANAPQLKKWGKQEKQLLAKLIKKGKVDLSCKNNLEYVDQVRFKYYRKCNYRNFHRNFCNYVQEQELENTVSGTHRKKQGIRYVMYLTLLLLIILTPAPSYFQSPESNQDDTSNDGANLMATTMSNNSKDSNDTINATMAKSSDKSMASAAAKKSAKQIKQQAANHRHSLVLIYQHDARIDPQPLR